MVAPIQAIGTTVTNRFPEGFTLELVAATAKTLATTDFATIDTHAGNYAIVIDTLKGPPGVQVKMHRTAAKDTVTNTEAATHFGPIMTKGIGDKRYPIASPFVHLHDNTNQYLTFRPNMDCTIIGRILRISTSA